MHCKFSMAMLATVTVALLPSVAFSGSSHGYSSGVSQQPGITAFNPSYAAPIPAAPPVMETYTMPAAPIMPAVPVTPEPRKDGFYDESRYGGNAEFGYEQQSACGGATTGEKCLVILSDHMRRVRLEGPAGTILVGNPLIADVTVLGNDTIFVSARSIGSTNIIVLDKQGNEMVTYEVFVREPRVKRVVLNNGGVIENYQCAPNCERALTQSDSPVPYNARSGIISTDLGLDRTAIGLQSGPNPNTEQPEQQTQSPLVPGPSAPPQGAGAPAASGAQPGADLAGSVQNLGNSLGPALGIANAANSLLGGGGGVSAGASAPVVAQPARTDAPPLGAGQGPF